MFGLCIFYFFFSFLHLGPFSLYYSEPNLFNFYFAIQAILIMSFISYFDNLHVCPCSLYKFPGFAYFMFNILLFRKNILLLLLYPKHVIKLLGYNFGCYTHPFYAMSVHMKCNANVSLPIYTMLHI